MLGNVREVLTSRLSPTFVLQPIATVPLGQVAVAVARKHVDTFQLEQFARAVAATGDTYEPDADLPETLTSANDRVPLHVFAFAVLSPSVNGLAAVPAPARVNVVGRRGDLVAGDPAILERQ